uniref:poly(ADP-ribose) glycohydrolase n=1 Tax=Chromera velia CCMP2878 TaxID=1169474 RepID=A0A0G4HYK5_9ALVE|eukprot:Cvel_1538.t1-p1 / transcript=Cvel_1538.t1 / gene=Cvel_1538 / organism=Chromera_velia_CCMP2878 / gene_product=Poly(ADP-ribose) glycohydrolase, putative / transcript_product=Poly(ADP-ribose) glycohydrolase, putative / location=Cvel_scaffold54:72166-75819(-) / protein_length=769 / sequence_SO=supercontig / SO=protein_coding / is_pseudo=false
MSEEKTKPKSSGGKGTVSKNYILLPFQKSSWSKVKKELEKPVETVGQLIESFTRLAYANSVLKSKSQYNGVEALFEAAFEIDPDLCERFLLEVVPRMKELLLNMKSIFKEPIPLLKRGMRGSVVISEKQVLCLICCGFFQILPESSSSDKLGSLNFRKFYRTPVSMSTQAQKLICLFHYFDLSFPPPKEPTPTPSEGGVDAGERETLEEREKTGSPASKEKGKGKVEEGDGEKGGEGTQNEQSTEKPTSSAVEPSLVFTRRVLSEKLSPDFRFWEESNTPLSSIRFAPEVSIPESYLRAQQEAAERAAEEANGEDPEGGGAGEDIENFENQEEGQGGEDGGEEDPLADGGDESEEDPVAVTTLTPSGEEEDFSMESTLPSLHATRPGSEVLTLGAETEEIIYLEHPELLVSLCLFEKLSANECMSVAGAKRTVLTEGHRDSFKVIGRWRDPVALDSGGIRKREFTSALPASYTRQPESQFEEAELLLELNKVYMALNPLIGTKSSKEIQAAARAHTLPDTSAPIKKLPVPPLSALASQSKSYASLGASSTHISEFNLHGGMGGTSGTDLRTTQNSLATALSGVTTGGPVSRAVTAEPNRLGMTHASNGPDGGLDFSAGEKDKDGAEKEKEKEKAAPVEDLDCSHPAVRATWVSPDWELGEGGACRRVYAVPSGVGKGGGGHPELRVILLWLAASQSRRSLLVRTPPDIPGVDLREELKEEDFTKLCAICEKKKIRVGHLIGLVLDAVETLVGEGVSLSHSIYHKLRLGV